MEERKLIHYLYITLKGMAMGIAELVPGVSGGTIAFVTGIYEEFISAINNVNLDTFKTLKNDGFKMFWKQLNGNFLLALFVGMMVSILSLSKVISWLLENHPIPVWAFFFGLVLASVIFVAKDHRILYYHATTFRKYGQPPFSIFFRGFGYLRNGPARNFRFLYTGTFGLI